METYIQRLRNLSKKPNNIKALNRSLLLDEYLLEVKRKISYGYKFDNNFLNQSILLKDETFKKGTDLRNSNIEFNKFVENEISKFNLMDFIEYLKTIKLNHKQKSHKHLYNTFNFFIDGNKAIVFFRHICINKFDLFNFCTDRGLYILKEK
jgi:hypothetical protein